jgi:hypothetical protein
VGGQGQDRLSDRQKRSLLDAFTRLDSSTGQRRFARIDKAEIAAIGEQEPIIRAYLDSLNKLLQTHRFHFGYRVFDEIAQYLHNSHENGMMEFQAAFDQAVFMKVLPKFSGSRARLRAPLFSLLAWALNPVNPESTLKSVHQSFQALDVDAAAALTQFTSDAMFPRVAARALHMLITLESDGFVAFG